MTRVVLISGKGGVGKTTVAAATAVRAAELGVRTLVVSVDRAHNLGDVLQQELGAAPLKVEGRPGLLAMEADPQAELHAHEAVLRGYFSRFLEWAGVARLEADEVAVVPGLEELLVLSRLAQLLGSGDYELLVVDLAPTAASLRLLSFPELLAGPLGKLLAWERRFLKLTRPAMKKLVDAPIPGEDVYQAIAALAQRLQTLRALLLDPQRAVVRLVSIPERVVVDETRSAHTLLSLFGLAVDTVVLNRVLPEELDGSYLSGWRGIQARELGRAEELFAGLRLRRLRFQPHEVLGVAALSEVARELYGKDDPSRLLAPTAPVRFETKKSGAQVQLALPHLPKGEVDLRQAGDELIITVGAWRRRLLLPASLRGRPVSAAKLSAGTLTLSFEPKHAKEKR